MREPSISTLLQGFETAARTPPSRRATLDNSVATEENLRFTLHDLAAPILRRKRTMSVTVLFVVSLTLLLDHTRLQNYQSPTTGLPHNITLPSIIPLLPAQGPAVTILISIILGLLIGLFSDLPRRLPRPMFPHPAQVIRTPRIPLVVAIPKRTP